MPRSIHEQLRLDLGDFGKKVASEIKETAPNIQVRAGVAEVPYPEDSNVTTADVAITHELGLGVPARPFLSTVFYKNINAYQNKIIAQLRSSDTVAVFQRTGVKIQNDIQNSILSGGWQPNSKATIENSGDAGKKPLIDTGLLLRSITWEIV